MKIKKRTKRHTKKVSTTPHSSFISCPEYVAEHIVETIQKFGDYSSAVELCCCIGSTCIQLAKVFDNVVGIDIDKTRIEMARKNARLYEVSSNTKFIVGDILDIDLLKSIKANIAVLDPEWSTRKMDRSSHVSDINLTQPSLKEMFNLTSKYITKNIITRVPATFSEEVLSQLGICKVDNIIINGDLVFKVCYYLDSINEYSEEDIIFE